MSAAGRLAAEVAHQIKNPLGIINNAAFSLQRSLLTGDRPDPAVARQLQVIRDEVERSDRIITELIGFAQLAEGRIERLDVVEELDLAVQRVFPAGAGFGVRIERDFRPPVPALFFSRRSLGEVFDNLLKNARDVLEGRGTVRLGVKGTSDLGVEVTIADDGPGIPPENRERVFEAYFTTKPGGTGLGLAIVKQNVELFGGRMELESEVGRGTCFHLRFPGRAALRLQS
jgi:signal transduction histidine kinase